MGKFPHDWFRFVSLVEPIERLDRGPVEKPLVLVRSDRLPFDHDPAFFAYQGLERLAQIGAG